jgi:repressor LexA
MKLTNRQTEVLECIRKHIESTGYPPTRADIARELGFKSANAAEEHLKALARKGAIELTKGTSRGIRLPEAEQPDTEGLPVIGQVAAGEPILAQEHVEDHCTISADFFRPRADYLLRVKGMSMKNIGIMDGDLLAVHQTR